MATSVPTGVKRSNLLDLELLSLFLVYLQKRHFPSEETLHIKEKVKEKIDLTLPEQGCKKHNGETAIIKIRWALLENVSTIFFHI